MAEYRPNKAKQKLEAGGVISIVNGVNDGDTAEMFGSLGFDAILAEGEHGPISWEVIGDISRACDLWGMASVVRVHRNDPALVTRALDRGANGIMVPHVNTLEEAELVARSSRYGPEGNRGAFGGRRSLGVGGYHRKANDHTLVTILLEDIPEPDEPHQHIDLIYFCRPLDGAPTDPSPDPTLRWVEEGTLRANRPLNVAGRDLSAPVATDVRLLALIAIDTARQSPDSRSQSHHPERGEGPQ